MHDQLEHILRHVRGHEKLPQSVHTSVAALPPDTIDLPLPSGMTLLGTACLHKRLPLIDTLLANGARTTKADLYNLLPCDWLSGIYEPQARKKTNFRVGFHHLVDSQDSHDDCVMMHALHSMLKAGSADPHQLPYISPETVPRLNPAKHLTHIASQFVCSCDKYGTCTCAKLLPPHIDTALANPECDVQSLAEYLHALSVDE